jgi:hypothetical protein
VLCAGAVSYGNQTQPPSAVCKKIPPGAVILAFLGELHLASAQPRTGSMHRNTSCDATKALPGIVDTAPYDRYVQHSMFSYRSRAMAIVPDRKSALPVYRTALPWIRDWPVESSASGCMRVVLITIGLHRLRDAQPKVNAMLPTFCCIIGPPTGPRGAFGKSLFENSNPAAQS